MTWCLVFSLIKNLFDDILCFRYNSVRWIGRTPSGAGLENAIAIIAVAFSFGDIFMDVYDKPFKTFDELVDLLQIKHGLTVPDREIAKQILQCTPY